MHNHLMKNVIVTGANGFIGSSLIKKLVDEGVAVVAVDLSFAVSRLPENLLVTKIESGVDAFLADSIPAGEYDAFYHLAWRGVNGAEKLLGKGDGLYFDSEYHGFRNFQSAMVTDEEIEKLIDFIENKSIID